MKYLKKKTIFLEIKFGESIESVNKKNKYI